LLSNFDSMLLQNRAPIVHLIVKEITLPANSTLNWVNVSSSYEEEHFKPEIFLDPMEENYTQIVIRCINESDIEACINSKLKVNVSYPYPAKQFWYEEQTLLDGRIVVRVFIPIEMYLSNSTALVLKKAMIEIDYNSAVELSVKAHDCYAGKGARLNISIYSERTGNATILIYIDDELRWNESIGLGNWSIEKEVKAEEGLHKAQVILLAEHIRIVRSDEFEVKTAARFSAKKKNGEACRTAGDCLNGYCVHGYCRSKPYYCGDGYCDWQENCYSCSLDCGLCHASYGLDVEAPVVVFANQSFAIRVVNKGSYIRDVEVESNGTVNQTVLSLRRNEAVFLSVKFERAGNGYVRFLKNNMLIAEKRFEIKEREIKGKRTERFKKERLRKTSRIRFKGRKKISASVTGLFVGRETVIALGALLLLVLFVIAIRVKR